MEVRAEGPIPARIMLVGEAPGEQEEYVGVPFVGASGQELNRMLHDAGIMRSECFTTNVCRVRPRNNDIGNFVAMKKKDITPNHIPLRDKYVLPVVRDGYNMLLKEIDLVKPNIIVALGNLALWSLTGHWGITKWRGSMLYTSEGLTQHRAKLIPVLHPAAILRQWELRAPAVQDLKRVARELGTLEYANIPPWRFIVRPSLPNVLSVFADLEARLEGGETWIDFDIETRSGHIACAGISWSLTEALCIPFMCVENRDGYWPLEEETAIIHGLYRILTHRNARVRAQNGLYDCQYTLRHWQFAPRIAQDTMISHHTAFSALRKALDFQASMYCQHYIYWKDDGKEWDRKMGEDTLWNYNCVDCIRTREVGEVELSTIQSLGLQGPHALQQAMFWPVLAAMNRGLRIDRKRRDTLAQEIQHAIDDRQAWLTEVVGHPINPRSSPQMCALFYTDLAQPPIMTRAKKGVPGHLTCDDEALQRIKAREPILGPVVDCIGDIRTLGVFLSTFILAKEDVDGRMRSSFNICGTGTYRLSSSENAFGSGGNLQNIPSDKSKSMGKASKRGESGYVLPNIRELYIPDVGYTMFDGDLDRADLQVVVWETNDALLKAALRIGTDIHLLNAFVLDGRDPPPLDELVQTHPRYPDHLGPRKLKREFAKVFCHATNYVGSARTVAIHTGRTVQEVDRAQRIWFGAHPGIKDWHTEIEKQVNKRRYVENKFGFRWYIFDRTDMILPEAVAWIPQSTVGIVINKIWLNIYETIPQAEVLIQVHDSLVGQFPTDLRSTILPQLRESYSSVTVPYDDPLKIPFGIKTSEASWGACM